MRPVLRICQVPKSTYYYRLKNPVTQRTSNGGRPIPGYSWNHKGQKVSDTRIRSYLKTLIQGEESVYGYRKLTRCLVRRYGLRINKKKVYRLCKELQILLPQREKQNRPPRNLANNRVITGPNQLWQMDIKYGYVAGKKRHFYLASIIDVYDRAIVAHHLGKACSATDITTMVNKALIKRQIFAQDSQLTIRTDNGPQFISNAFYAFCQDMKLEHERIPNKTPNKNAYIESFHSVLERECYQRHVFDTFQEAFVEVDRYIRFYNDRRLHGSLYDWPPSVFLEKLANQQVIPFEIAV